MGGATIRAAIRHHVNVHRRRLNVDAPGTGLVRLFGAGSSPNSASKAADGSVDPSISRKRSLNFRRTPASISLSDSRCSTSFCQFGTSRCSSTSFKAMFSRNKYSVARRTVDRRFFILLGHWKGQPVLRQQCSASALRSPLLSVIFLRSGSDGTHSFAKNTNEWGNRHMIAPIVRYKTT
jgi:hypothetical protein